MLSLDEQKLRAIWAWAKTRKRVAVELLSAQPVWRTRREPNSRLGPNAFCPSAKRM